MSNSIPKILRKYLQLVKGSGDMATKKKSVKERSEAAHEKAHEIQLKIVDPELLPQIEATEALICEAEMNHAIYQIARRVATVHHDNLVRLRQALIENRDFYAISDIMDLFHLGFWEDKNLGFARAFVTAVNEQYADRLPPIKLVCRYDMQEDVYCHQADARICFVETSSD